MAETKQIESVKIDSEKYIFVKNNMKKLIIKDLIIFILNTSFFFLVYHFLHSGVLQVILLISSSFVASVSASNIYKYYQTITKLKKAHSFLIEKIKKYNL